jgi:hypothetical protein
MASLLEASSDTASSRSSAEVECIWSLRCFNLQPVLDAHAYSSINWFMERNNLTILVNHCIESGDNILWDLIFSVVHVSAEALWLKQLKISSILSGPSEDALPVWLSNTWKRPIQGQGQ